MESNNSNTEESIVIKKLKEKRKSFSVKEKHAIGKFMLEISKYRGHKCDYRST